MIEHRCSIGERGGFFERLRRGTYLAHILEHVTLELQGLAGSPLGYGRARETMVEGLFRVAIRYDEEALAGPACWRRGELSGRGVRSPLRPRSGSSPAAQDGRRRADGRQHAHRGGCGALAAFRFTD